MVGICDHANGETDKAKIATTTTDGDGVEEETLTPAVAPDGSKSIEPKPELATRINVDPQEIPQREDRVDFYWAR